MSGGTWSGDDLPTFDAHDPEASRTGRSAGGPSGPPLGAPPGPARGAGLAAGLVILLVVVIAIGGQANTAATTESPAASPTADATLTATATVSPVVPSRAKCSDLPATATTSVELRPDGGGATPGAADDAAVPVVKVLAGLSIQLQIDGAICAPEWNITWEDGLGGATTFGASANDAGAGSGFGAENRWEFKPEAGSGLLTAVLRFPAGIEITRSWQLSVDPFVIPPLYLVADDGARFQASPGCGLTLTFANAYETRETCNSFGYEPTRAALRVRAYRPLHLDLEGWQITTWYAACGRADQWQGSPDYYDTSTCGTLGGAASDSGSVLTEPAAFILPPGETVVQIRITAVEARGNRFNAPYYARVIAR